MRRLTVLLLLVLSTLANVGLAAGARKTVYQVQPALPELARKMNLHGLVKVELLIDESGTVKATKVIGGHPVLAEAAETAVKKWKYAPAPSETKTVVEVEF